MQKELAGFTTQMTGGVIVAQGPMQQRAYRQLPKVDNPTDVNMTVTRIGTNELRFTLANLQMPIIVNAQRVTLTPHVNMSTAVTAGTRGRLSRVLACAVDDRLIPTEMMMRGTIVADLVLGCPLSCGFVGSCKIKNGKAGCLCDCGWAGAFCSEPTGFCPMPVSYMLPGNTSDFAVVGVLPIPTV